MMGARDHTSKKRIHRAWWVFIGVCLMMAGGMGLVLNIMGNFFAPMAVNFGLINPETGAPDVTQVTLLMTAYSYTMLISLPLCGRLFDRIDARILFGITGALIVLAEVLLGVWTEVWQIYISGVLLGLAGPAIFLVGPSFLINNWFAPKQAGKFLGIASAFTGVGTFIWSPIFAGIIASQGYQFAFFIEAIVSAILIVLPAIFMVRTSPESMGLEQYGIEKELQAADDGAETGAAGAAGATATTTAGATNGASATSAALEKAGVSAKFAVATIAFWAILVGGGLISLGGGYKSLMPTAVQSVGGEELAMLGAAMLSAAAVGNIIGKVVLGFLADKIGIKATMVIFAIVSIVGFALMVFFLGGDMVPMLAAGFCIGTSDAMMSVGLPLVTRACYGDRCYGEIFSYLSMSRAIFGGLGATFVAVVAGLTGGFQASYACGIVTMIIVAACMVIACVKAKKYQSHWS